MIRFTLHEFSFGSKVENVRGQKAGVGRVGPESETGRSVRCCGRTGEK